MDGSVREADDSVAATLGCSVDFFRQATARVCFHAHSRSRRAARWTREAADDDQQLRLALMSDKRERICFHAR